jgi:hypothetical protein
MNFNDTFIESKTNIAQDILNYFNEVCGTRLRITLQKSKQINNRLKFYTVEEIKSAILKRSKLDWYIQSGFSKDWDSLFRNDEKIDRILNLPDQLYIYISPTGQQKTITHDKFKQFKADNKIKLINNNWVWIG